MVYYKYRHKEIVDVFPPPCGGENTRKINTRLARDQNTKNPYYITERKMLYV
jgi:hypothetical protein